MHHNQRVLQCAVPCPEFGHLPLMPLQFLPTAAAIGSALVTCLHPCSVPTLHRDLTFPNPPAGFKSIFPSLSGTVVWCVMEEPQCGETLMKNARWEMGHRGTLYLLKIHSSGSRRTAFLPLHLLNGLQICTNLWKKKRWHHV